ncbi:MAG: tRNA (guanosine(37)-N1)-methyltransferase TrmD [Pirellulaceae bacterium]
MRLDVLTLFPEIFSGYLGQSLLSKAIENELVNVQLHDIRHWSNDKHSRVDDRPYGGGPGMVLMVEPLVTAVESVIEMDAAPAEIIVLTPTGQPFNQRVVEELARTPSTVNGLWTLRRFDQRLFDVVKPRELSLGDFILNGGEVAAMAVIDSVIRLIPGVLGDDESSRDDSFSVDNRLLEFPQYTRPREFRGFEVPEVLLSGNHGAIEKWRHDQSLKRTEERRRDLLGQVAPTESPKK